MWAWVKHLWGTSKGGGCISAAKEPRAAEQKTLSPLEPNLTSKTTKSVDVLQQASNDDLQQLQAQPEAGLHTPLQQTPVQKDSRGAADQQGGSEQQTDAAALPESAGRYMYSGGKPVGIANTVTKYQESRPLRPHLTPFEARVEAKIAEEEEVAAVRARGSSQPPGGDGDRPIKQLFTERAEQRA